MKVIKYLFGTVATISLVVSCSQSVDTKNAVAVIGKTVLTKSDLQVAKTARRIPLDIVDKAKNIKTLDNVMQQRLFALEAKASGLQSDTYTNKRIVSMQKRLLLQLYIETHINGNYGVDAKAIESHFNQNKTKFITDSSKTTFEQVKINVVKDFLLGQANLDSFYQANIANYTRITGKDTVTASLDSIKGRVEDEYIRNYKSALSKGMKGNLFEKYSVKTIEPKPKLTNEMLKAFYNEHLERYSSPAQYEVYHIETDSSSIKKIGRVKSLDEFKKLAAAKNTNQWTKKVDGYIGFIKEKKSLPYGIGMLPSIFPLLDSIIAQTKQGMTAPVANPFTGKSHLFWVASKKVKSQKPFERVKAIVEQNYVQEKGVTIEEAEIIATFGKGGTITEGDVVFLRKEIPPNQQQSYTRQALRDFILMWELGKLEIESLGLMKTPKVQSTLALDYDYQWAKIYEDSIVKSLFGSTNAELEKIYTENKAYFVSDTSKPYSEMLQRNVNIFKTIPKKEFEIEYYTNPSKYKKDTVLLSYSESKYRIFNNIRNRFITKPLENFVNSLKKKYQVKVLDSNYIKNEQLNSAEEFKKAHAFHLDRKLHKAIEQYDLVRTSFPEKLGLQDSVCRAKAQVLVELERFQEALTEYRRLLYLYPESANNYKAKFMIGFILAEHLKQEPAAVVVFKELLEKYPKCDLADDADWMIRNIESGGALMPKFEDG